MQTIFNNKMDTKKLRQKILDLAIRGKLVPQDPNDESASVLLERIRAEKERLIKEGKIKRGKKSASDMPHYENIPFEVPKGWEWCRLDSIGEIVTGSTPPKDNKEYYGGPIPFYKPTDLVQGIETVTSSDSLTEEGFAVSRQLSMKSILVTCIGATIGKTGMIKKAGTCNQQINAIVPYPTVFPDYIYYVCVSGFMQSNIKDNASATTLPILNKNHFAELLIPLPPIEEQKRIVPAIEQWFSLLDTLEDAKDDLQTTIAQAKSKILDLAIHGKLVPQDPNDEPAIELLKRINPKFIPCDNAHDANQLPIDWMNCKLKDICHIYGRIGFRGYTKDDLVPCDGAITLSPSNIIDGKMNYDDCKYISWKKYEESPEIQIANGDILLVKTGSSFGKCALVYGLSQEATINPQFVVLKNIVCNPQYLTFVLQSQYARNNYDEFVLGTAIPTFTQVVLGNMEIPLPPYSEQLRIVAKIEELFAVLDEIQESIEA